jgi:hypothetical protein
VSVEERAAAEQRSPVRTAWLDYQSVDELKAVLDELPAPTAQ